MAKIPIPRQYYKYFRSGTLEEFVEEGLAREDQVLLLNTFADELSKALNVKFLGWAFAKDAYMKILAEHGYGVLAIVQFDDGKRVLLDALGDEVVAVTREELDACFA